MAYKLDFVINKFIHDLNERILEAQEMGKSEEYLEGLNNALKIMLENKEVAGKLI